MFNQIYHPSYTGKLPCFLAGLDSLLLSNISKAEINLGLVILGTITSSTKPLSAAIYGLATVSLYSSIFFLTSFYWIIGICYIMFKYNICSSIWPPITAISAFGHANTWSAPKSLLHIAK